MFYQALRIFFISGLILSSFTDKSSVLHNCENSHKVLFIFHLWLTCIKNSFHIVAKWIKLYVHSLAHRQFSSSLSTNQFTAIRGCTANWSLFSVAPDRVQVDVWSGGDKREESTLNFRCAPLFRNKRSPTHAQALSRVRSDSEILNENEVTK